MLRWVVNKVDTLSIKEDPILCPKRKHTLQRCEKTRWFSYNSRAKNSSVRPICEEFIAVNFYFTNSRIRDDLIFQCFSSVFIAFEKIYQERQCKMKSHSFKMSSYKVNGTATWIRGWAAGSFPLQTPDQANLFLSHRVQLGFVLQLYWANLSYSFWKWTRYLAWSTDCTRLEHSNPRPW